MLFIHQQFQSFLNLGGCKEYSIMAKAKFPKKSNGLKETVPTTGNPATPSDTNFGPAEALAAVTVPETRKSETGKTETKTPARKPEIVRTEPRANLVPINLEDEIRRLAYLLSERRGFEPGHEAEDWTAAEREVRQRYHQQSA
jgi:Protein of unknown function (DUF2934)